MLLPMMAAGGLGVYDDVQTPIGAEKLKVCLHRRGTIAGWYDAARLAHRATVEQHVAFSSLTDAEIVTVRILRRNQDATGKVVSDASRPLHREAP